MRPGSAAGSQEFPSAHHARISKPQRRHERRMHLGGRDNDAVEFQVPGGAGIMDHRNAIAQVRGRTGDAIDAHVAHAADDDQLLDAVLVEDGLQLSLAKRIDEVLEYHRFIGAVEHLGVQLRAFGAGGEEGGIGGGEFVADVHDLLAGLAKGFDDLRRIVGGGFGTDQWPFTLGEVVVLDIDYDERLLGHGGFP